MYSTGDKGNVLVGDKGNVLVGDKGNLLVTSQFFYRFHETVH